MKSKYQLFIYDIQTIFILMYQFSESQEEKIERQMLDPFNETINYNASRRESGGQSILGKNKIDSRKHTHEEDSLRGRRSINNKQPINQKNKYISKLKNLEWTDKVKLDTVNQSHNEELDKKLKGKVFAKRCRDRKKLYVELMKQQQAKLIAEIKQKDIEIQQLRIEMQKAQTPSIEGFFFGGEQRFAKKLQDMMAKRGEINEQSLQNYQYDLNIIIDSLRFRIGATGRQRTNTINQYYKQIINLSLPTLHRYLLWTSADNYHLFNQNEENQANDVFNGFIQKIQLSSEQLSQIKSYGSWLKQHRKLLIGEINNLKGIKDQIYQKSLVLQGIIDNIRDNLSAMQSAHLIMFSEKSKYRKELNLSNHEKQ